MCNPSLVGWLFTLLLCLLVKVQSSCFASFCICQFIATFTSSFKTKTHQQKLFPLFVPRKMAPSGRTKTTTTPTPTTRRRGRTRTRQPRRTTHFKKQQHNTQSKKQEIITTVLPSISSCSSISSQDSSKEGDHMEIPEVIDVSNSNINSACSTPKGQKFRIPEISTCPPAPKKPRVLPNCSLRRSPLSFFSPPDLEHFFFVALRDVSV